MNQPVSNPTHQFLFSVVTAAYNAAPFLGMMLNSLTNQTLGFKEHIQLIIVDDGSTDHTADIVQKFVNQYPDNAILLRQKNAGPASARNYGLTMALGEWVSFIDSDEPHFCHLFRDRVGFPEEV